MYTNAEILTLAQVLARHDGVELCTISRRIFGKSKPHNFASLAQGRGCNSRYLEHASRWFNDPKNWPDNKAWPLKRKAEVPEDA